MPVRNKYVFLKHNERVTGPFLLDSIPEMLRNGLAAPSDQISHDKIDWFSITPPDVIPDQSPEDFREAPIPDTGTVRIAPEQESKPSATARFVFDPEQPLTKWHSIGRTLQLVWNGTDNMDVLNDGDAKSLTLSGLAAYGFAIFLSAISVFSTAIFTGQWKTRLLWMLLLPCVWTIVSLLENWNIYLICGREKSAQKQVWLLTFHELLAFTLLLCIKLLTDTVASCTGFTCGCNLFLMIAAIYYGINVSTAIQHGLVHRFQCSPHAAQWPAFFYLLQTLIAFIIIDHYLPI